MEYPVWLRKDVDTPARLQAAGSTWNHNDEVVSDPANEQHQFTDVGSLRAAASQIAHQLP
jgi:hypothetical protein